METFSWVNTKGGLWEDPYKQQNIKGAQSAIDIKVGAWKKGDESLDKYMTASFEKRRDEKGGFWPGQRGTCKDQATQLINDAIKQRVRDAAKKKGK